MLTVREACVVTNHELPSLVGPDLACKYGPDPAELEASAADPLLDILGGWTPADLLAPALISAGARTMSAFTDVVGDEAALLDHRRAAVRAAETAALIWSH